MADFFAKGKNPINGYGGQDHGVVELWENPSVTSDYAGQSFTISSTKQFDMYFIEWVVSKTHPELALVSACENTSGRSAELIRTVITTAGKVISDRRIVDVTQVGNTITVTASDTTELTLNTYGSAPASATTNNACIPARILGVLHND